MYSMTETRVVPTRAGMVCFNRVSHVLIVSAMGKTNEWVLPKGHIEKGETSFVTAVREVREEASIESIVVSPTPIGVTDFWMPGTAGGEHVVTEWWTGVAIKPAELDPHYNESDLRVVKWVEWKTALEALSYPDQRNMLRRALCLPERDHGKVTTLPEVELGGV